MRSQLNQKMFHKLSIIICTYNRANFLSSCLKSLTKQTILVENFEVVVIDNNSTDNTHAVASSFADSFPFFKYYFEKQQGLSYARNAGVEIAAGEWVAYLDDDAVAHDDWVEVLLETIHKGDFDVFGGVYTAWHVLRERPKWFSPDWETNASVARTYSTLSTGYPSGGNCAYKKELINLYGEFPNNLGMRGKKIGYGEETSLIDKIRSNGGIIGFVPCMLIDHCVLEYKYSLKWRLVRAFCHGRDSILLWGKADTICRWKELAKIIYSASVLPAKALVTFAVTKEYFWQNLLLDSFSPLLFSLGRIKALVFTHDD